jgi:glutamine synthetase
VAADALAEVNTHENDDPFKQALESRDEILPRMVALRALCDDLESRVAADLWPLPSYRELLFIK